MQEKRLRKSRWGTKSLAIVLVIILLSASLSGCSTNPATGEQQFAALMSPQQEQRIGAQQHQEIAEQFGISQIPAEVQDYVQSIGEKVAANTERPDVQYKFYVVDDEMVNAFAVPGGYIYVSRGLLAHAGSEAEVAAVLAHEIGHITARHSAERYSQGIVTAVGATVLSAILDSSVASQALGLGSDLYIKSYSRGQEHQADELGIRYLHRAGYDPFAMSRFLQNLENYTALQMKLAGQNQAATLHNYFSTHPQTADRVERSVAIAERYADNGNATNRDEYLRKIDALVYGGSARQGLVREQNFYHPQMDFTFSVPEGFRLINQPEQVIATHDSGTAVIFDADRNPQNLDPYTYMTEVWMQGEPLQDVEKITVNGKEAATASFPGRINGMPVTIRIVAVQWAPQTFFRFQMAMPGRAPASLIDGLKRTTYSLRPMTAEEKQEISPYRVRIIMAAAGDTVATLARRMPFTVMQEERFRVLNGMSAGQQVQPGRQYKIVTP